MTPSLEARLRARQGALTAELVREPGAFGLGQVPARLNPDATTTVVCGFCSTGCGLNVHLKEGSAINLTADPEYPVARDRLGWWTQAGDVDALSSTVEEFSRISDDHLAALAERCREHARTKFDWDRIAERCLMALPMRTFRGIGHD